MFVRMAWISFGALPCRGKRNLMTVRVSMLLKSRASSLTCFRACFFSGRAKNLSAPRYNLLPVSLNSRIFGCWKEESHRRDKSAVLPFCLTEELYLGVMTTGARHCRTMADSDVQTPVRPLRLLTAKIARVELCAAQWTRLSSSFNFYGYPPF